MSPPKPIICDNTLLSNFATVDRLELLPKVFSEREIYTTAYVLDEIGAGVEAGYTHLIPLETLLLKEKKTWITILLHNPRIRRVTSSCS